jgi:hypothetical protein
VERSSGSKDIGFGSLKGKMVILGDSGEFLESLEWLEGVGTKDRGSC